MSSGSELSFGWVPADEFEESTLNNSDDSMGIDTQTDSVVIKTERIDDSYNDAGPAHRDISNNTKRHKPAANTFRNNTNTTLDSSDKLADFLDKNPKLVNAVSSNVNEIESDDEVWLVQFPHDFNVESIVGLPLFNNDKTKIKIAGTKYEWVTMEKMKEERITTLTPSTKHKGSVISSIPVKGKIIVREKIKSSGNTAQLPKESTENVPFPTDLKIRHPLFGINYKKEIELSDEIQQRLKELPKMKKKSKTTDKHKKQDIIADVSEVNSVKQNQSSKKKRKVDLLEDDVVNPSKKIKIEKNSWENETSIEMNLFQLPKKNKI